ncbi:MAG: DUF4890 domain-containing protein [Candidatus Symbiothrix sp.]|jgi:Spy/CpxP family protein refolding chaperone|nr:DUF4890 domain-containing protein [Candidatus Symbiothrix sp.]
MKKSVFTALLLCASTMIFAQPGQRGQVNPEEMAKRQTERMKTELKLSDEQVVLVDSINVAYAKKQAELFQSSGDDREAMREKMMALNTEKNKAIEAVLTEEQVKKFKESNAQRMGGGRNGGQNGPDGPPRN